MFLFLWGVAVGIVLTIAALSVVFILALIQEIDNM